MRSLHYWTILHAESSNTKITFFSNWFKKIILKLPNYRRLFQIAHYNQHEGRFSKIPNKIVKRSGPQSSAGKVHGRPYNTAHESCLFNKRAEQSPKCRASLTPLHSLQHAVSDPIIINSFSSAKGNQHTSKSLFLYCILEVPAIQITKLRDSDETRSSCSEQGAERNVTHKQAPL